MPGTHASSSWRLLERESAIVQRRRDGHRAAAPKSDRRLIGVINRIGQHDAPIVVDQGAQGRTDAERGTVGDQDLAVGIVRQAPARARASRRRHGAGRAHPGCRDSRCGHRAGPFAQPRRYGPASAYRAVRASSETSERPSAWSCRTSCKTRLTAVGRNRETRSARCADKPWPELAQSEACGITTVATLPCSETPGSTPPPRRPTSTVPRQAPG